MTLIIILCVVGVLALLAELVLPGGLLGVVGAFCLIAAVGITYVRYGATAGSFALLALVIFSMIVVVLWMKNFHRLPVTKQFVLNDEVGTDENSDRLQEIVGSSGTALTDIAPSGRALIDGEKIDVMAQGTSVSKGSDIRVVSTNGPSVFVREVAPK